VVADEVLFVGSVGDYNGVYALDSASGRQLWNYSSVGINLSPTVVEEIESCRQSHIFLRDLNNTANSVLGALIVGPTESSR